MPSGHSKEFLVEMPEYEKRLLSFSTVHSFLKDVAMSREVEPHRHKPFRYGKKYENANTGWNVLTIP